MSEFRCWLPFDASEEDAVVVHAYDAWMAAKEFAKREDAHAGGEIAYGALRSGAAMRVHVRTPDNNLLAWDVWPEAEVHWYARAVKEAT